MTRRDDPELDAVLAVLDPLGGPRVAVFLNVPLRRFDVEAIRRAARAWSSGEQVLVDVAAALWRGHGNVDLGRLVSTLDDRCMLAVLDGIAIRRGDDTR